MLEDSQELLGKLTTIGLDLGINVISALLLVILGWMAAGWVQRGLRRSLGRIERMDATLTAVIAGIGRYFVLITVLIMVLARFGVQTASILAALGALGLAVGLALQGTLANIASGVMLLFMRPFGVGDYVNANGHEGTVDEIGLFTTEMTTYDGIYLSVPNSGLWGGPIINYSRNPTRRHDIVIGIHYADDIDEAQRVLLDVLAADPRVHSDPQPVILVRELADSSVNLGMRFWTSGDDFWPANFELRKQAKLALENNGLTIPFPQRQVHVYQHDAA